MDLRPRAHRWGFVCLGASVMSGCATYVTPPPLPTQADVRVGPAIELLAFKTTFGDHVRAVPDAAGRVHVLIAAGEPKAVYEVVVQSDGVVSRTPVQKNVSPESIDAAFDQHGQLHALVGDKHFIRDNEAWVQSDQTPWGKVGLEIEKSSLSSEERGPRFVRGAPALIWAFEVSGGKVGANWRVDWYQPYTPLPIPWIARGEKTVLVSQSEAGETWTVLEQEDKHDTIASCLASDRQGDVFVVYQRGRVILQVTADPIFLKISAKELFAADLRADRSSLNRDGHLPLRSTIAGIGLTTELWERLGYDALEMLRREDCLAADPDDGSVLLGGRMLLQSGHWKFTSQFPDIYSRWYKWRAASAGSGTYHGVASYKRSYFSSDRRIAYGRLIGTTWETAELGPAAKEALDIAAFGPEKAFVIWETDQGVVGHWVEIAVRKE